METWKQIKRKGYTFQYEVSNYGQVRNMKTGRIMKLSTNGAGYLFVSLPVDYWIRMQVSVHILVAEAFIEKPERTEEVHHKDSDKKNNHYLNLKFVTPTENAQEHYKMEKIRKQRKQELRAFSQ